MTRRRIRYAYEMCPALENGFWRVAGQSADWPSDAAKLLLDELADDYLRYRRTGTVNDKLAAWRISQALRGVV